MINEKNKAVTKKDKNLELEIINEGDCEKKLEEINKKLQQTVNDLEKINALYTKSIKEDLEKRKKIKVFEEELKNCQEEKEKLEEQIKECQETQEQLKEELQECQNNNKKSEGNKGQWINGEYKWMPIGSNMPKGWVKVELEEGLTLVQGQKSGVTTGDIKEHKHQLSDKARAFAVKKGNTVWFFNHTNGSIRSDIKHLTIKKNEDGTWITETKNEGKTNNMAAGLFAELWQYQEEDNKN